MSMEGSKEGKGHLEGQFGGGVQRRQGADTS